MSAAIGSTGTVRVRVPGTADPGEVELPVRGGCDRFLADAAAELAEGAAGLVIERVGARAVRVTP
ncbi:MAG: hypothetical protein LBQ06_00355, partial [Frankiaceae bacterium]|nr:hypothetical protein [Frankiaceae bacterium]